MVASRRWLTALTEVHVDVFTNSPEALDCGFLGTYDSANIFKARYDCRVKIDPKMVNPSDKSDSGGSQFSTEAEAGISVDAILGTALLASIVFLTLKRSRNRHPSRPPETRDGRMGKVGATL
jgi:hypothetical protein